MANNYENEAPALAQQAVKDLQDAQGTFICFRITNSQIQKEWEFVVINYYLSIIAVFEKFNYISRKYSLQYTILQLFRPSVAFILIAVKPTSAFSFASLPISLGRSPPIQEYTRTDSRQAPLSN